MSPDPANRSLWAPRVYSVGLALLGLSLPLSLVAAEILWGGLLALLLLSLVRREKIPFSRWDLFFLAFLLLRPLSAFYHADAQHLAKGLTTFAFCLAYLLVAWDDDNRRQGNWDRLVRWFIVGAALASLYGVYQALAGAPRGTGFYGGWVVFGSLTGLALVLGTYATIAGRMFRRNLWNIALLSACAAGLAVSECRTEWFAAALVLLPAALLFYARFAALIGAGIIAAFLAIAPLRERLTRLTNPLQDLIDRGIIWNPSFDLIRQKPWLGHGLNSFNSIFPQTLRQSMYDPGAGDWHNVYLQVAVESGLLGLATFLLLLAAGIFLAYRAIRRAQDRKEQAAIWGLFCGLAFFCITGGLGTFLVRITVVIVVFLLLGRIFHLRTDNLHKP